MDNNCCSKDATSALLKDILDKGVSLLGTTFDEWSHGATLEFSEKHGMYVAGAKSPPPSGGRSLCTVLALQPLPCNSA